MQSEGNVGDKSKCSSSGSNKEMAPSFWDWTISVSPFLPRWFPKFVLRPTLAEEMKGRLNHLLGRGGCSLAPTQGSRATKF